MTYRELLEELKTFSEEELDLAVKLELQPVHMGTTDVGGDREDWATLPIILVNGLAKEEAEWVECLKRMDAGDHDAG
jgi:hypothetical protein